VQAAVRVLHEADPNIVVVRLTGEARAMVEGASAALALPVEVVVTELCGIGIMSFGACAKLSSLVCEAESEVDVTKH
jgi:hypothetical protein